MLSDGPCGAGEDLGALDFAGVFADFVLLAACAGSEERTELMA